MSQTKPTKIQDLIHDLAEDVADAFGGDIDKHPQHHFEEYTHKALSDLIAEIIGEDEKHSNGQKMVNDPSVCMDCNNPDERFCRNQLRQEQRARAKQLGIGE